MIPTNEREVFEDLIRKAKERGDGDMTIQDRNELERMAEQVGYPYDDKSYHPRNDTSAEPIEYDPKFDEQLAKYL